MATASVLPRPKRGLCDNFWHTAHIPDTLTSSWTPASEKLLQQRKGAVNARSVDRGGRTNSTWSCINQPAPFYRLKTTFAASVFVVFSIRPMTLFISITVPWCLLYGCRRDNIVKKENSTLGASAAARSHNMFGVYTV
jgi:hypothetical protein